MYKNILIYNSGGGLGDSIQLFPLILSLKNHFKQSNFHYLGAHENHFTAALRDYKISIKTLNLGIKFFGFRWWHFLKAKKELSLTTFSFFPNLRSEQIGFKYEAINIYDHIGRIASELQKTATIAFLYLESQNFSNQI